MTASSQGLERWALARMRGLIDQVDDGLIVWLAIRRKLVTAVAALKSHAGTPRRDPDREHYVQARARALAARIGVPDETAQRLVDLAISDACRQQELLEAADEKRRIALDSNQGASAVDESMMSSMPLSSFPSTVAPRLLRWMPPPRRLAPVVRAMPVRWQQALLEAAIARVLASPLRDGSLGFMEGRRLGIEVNDLGLRWVLALHGGRLSVVSGEPEASVRGSVTDLLLLASRLEDADTLFFQRALVLTGDTELGLTVRNLLERLPWEEVPLGLRIALNRGARLARMARQVHRGQVA